MARKRRTRGLVGRSGIELADEFLAERERLDPREVEDTRAALTLAAEYLVDGAGTPRWDAFEAKEFFRRIDDMEPRQLEGIALVLMGVYGWLTFTCRLDPGVGMGIMEGLRDRFPTSRILGDLYRSAEAGLREAIAETN